MKHLKEIFIYTPKKLLPKKTKIPDLNLKYKKQIFGRIVKELLGNKLNNLDAG